MATRSFTVDTSTDEAASAQDASCGVGRINHHRLTVLAASMPDVVRRAGGWLFDRSRDGWEVTVLVEDRHDIRPLTILGATCRVADSVSVLRDLPPDSAIAVSAELLTADARVRAHVVDLAGAGAAQVTVWGERPAEVGGRAEPAEHRLSVAAKAFKACALAAAETSAEVGSTETLFALRAESGRALYPV